MSSAPGAHAPLLVCADIRIKVLARPVHKPDIFGGSGATNTNGSLIEVLVGSYLKGVLAVCRFPQILLSCAVHHTTMSVKGQHTARSTQHARSTQQQARTRNTLDDGLVLTRPCEILR